MAGPTHHELETPKITGSKRVLIVRAPYYLAIVENLTKGARAVLDEAGVQHETIDVPGALEVPTAIAIASRTNRFDGYVALGCVIRGETTHYETVCNDSSRALSTLGLAGHPIGNGILTVETEAQAEVRADPDGQNKGGGAAKAALHLIHLADTLFESKPIGFAPESENIIIA